MPSSFDLSPLEWLLERQPGHKLWALAENSFFDDGSYSDLRHQRTASGNLARQENTDSVFGEGYSWPETANGCLDLQSAETIAERHNCELRRRSDIFPRFSPGRQKSVANNLPGEHC